MADDNQQANALEKLVETLDQEMDTATIKANEAKAAIDQASAELSSNRTALEAATADRRAVEASLNATVKVRTDLTTAGTNLQTALTQARSDLTNLETHADELAERVAAELSESRRERLEAQLKAIDDEIAGLETTFTQAMSAAEEAQQSADSAGKDAATADDKYLQKMSELTTLPKEIDERRTRAIAISEGAAKAVDSGRMAEAFVKTLDLGIALSALKEKIEAAADSDVAVALPGLWADKVKATKALAAATKHLAEKQSEATSAKRLLDEKVVSREKNIIAIVNEPPAPEGNSPVDRPGSSPDTTATSS